jgi:hypothetical protein
MLHTGFLNILKKKTKKRNKERESVYVYVCINTTTFRFAFLFPTGDLKRMAIGLMKLTHSTLYKYAQ